MDIRQYNAEILENKARRSVKYRRLLFFVVFSAAMMMLLLLLSDIFASDTFLSLRGLLSTAMGIDAAENAVFREVTAIGFNMLVTLVTMIIPIIPVCVMFDVSPFRITRPPIKRDPSAWQYIPLAIGCGYVVSLFVNLFSGGIFERFYEGSMELPTTLPGVIMFYILVAVFPAIFEEIAFRGVFLNSLLPYGKSQAIVISAVVFGSMHINPPQAIFACAFGLIVGKLYTVTGSILPGSLVHFTVNAISVTVSLITNRYGADNPEVASPLAIFIVIMMLAAIVFGVIIICKAQRQKKLVNLGEIPSCKLRTVKEAVKSLFSFGKPLFLSFAPYVYIIIYSVTLAIRFFPDELAALFSIVP